MIVRRNTARAIVAAVLVVPLLAAAVAFSMAGDVRSVPPTPTSTTCCVRGGCD